MTAYRITNARIIDGTGAEPFAGSVRVEDGRIAEVLHKTSEKGRS